MPSLPTPQIHPLPQFLETGPDVNHQGDYFDQIQPTEVGYLIWSEFPIRVYVEPLPVDHAGGAGRSQIWLEAVQQAIADWQAYVPLALTEHPDQAHITIRPQTPPLNRNGNDFRSRSAETRYTLYRQTHPNERSPQLVHRFTLLVRPSQTASYLRAAVRHELGHALGLWGHSPNPSDALYFAQIRTPVSISERDINTLKRVYQQPTRLGWPLPLESTSSLRLPDS